MSKNSEHVLKWRAVTKHRIMEAMGGSCVVCSYDRSYTALEFHHVNPNEKEFQIGTALMSPKSWDRIAAELRKCVMVCANCHREVHAGVADVPMDAARFNEHYADYKQIARNAKMDKCPICAGPKKVENVTCSLRCAGVKHTKVDWTRYDIVEMSTRMTNGQIGAIIGVSDKTISKRLRAVGVKRHK